PKTVRPSYIPRETTTDAHHHDGLGDVGREGGPGPDQLARQSRARVRRKWRRALRQARHVSPLVAASSSLASTRSESKSISLSDNSGAESSASDGPEAAGGA